MADEPRRSGRATKGQHKNASSSPGPAVKPTRNAPPNSAAGSSKGKPSKKAASSQSAEPEGGKKGKTGDVDDEDDDEEELIRCICGDNDPVDKRAFISCDACTAWQHNICMGMPEDEEDLPMHYFCEQCRPEEHHETLQAIERGERIWDTRARMFQNEKKMSKSRKSRAKSGEQYRPAWWRKDLPPQAASTEEAEANTEPGHKPEPEAEPASNDRAKANSNLKQEPQAAPAEEVEEHAPPSAVPLPQPETDPQPKPANKRKREETKDEPEDPSDKPADKQTRSSRQDKRRKSSAMQGKTVGAEDAETALVDIETLPQDRRKVAQSLAAILATGIEGRVKSGHKLPQGQDSSTLSEKYAAAIEYSMHMNHGVGQTAYSAQFRAINANLKKNRVLVQRLLDGSLTADELSTMSSSDMASEELQRERAELKEMLDRQATVDQPEGPRYAQDHKGYHLIETASQQQQDPQFGKTAAPPLPSASPSLTSRTSMSIDAAKVAPTEQRSSSQQFDINNIWAKTAQSPTNPTPPVGQRPSAAPSRRRSSVHQQIPANGAKDDPDIDRMLEDNDDAYAPPEASGPDAVVWRGKLVQTSEETAPTVNARFIAGRDLAATIPWQNLLPRKLSIDGRLQIPKAEDYLCGLRWSNTSDVAVLALSAYDNAEAFNEVFEYFKSRQRYAVVEKDKPPMVKDLYIIPVEAKAKLPGHVNMLEHCSLKSPVEERLLLATLIVARAPASDSPMKDPGQGQSTPVNGHLPQHMRQQSVGGPAGSPLTNHQSTFQSSINAPPPAGYGSILPPNPYGPQLAQAPTYPQAPPGQPHGELQVSQILGDLQWAPTAQTILGQGNALTLDQLLNLKAILTENVNARTDMEALARHLKA